MIDTLGHVRVLLIEDDDDDMLIIKKLFSKINGDSFSLDWVQTYEDAAKEIDKKAHDLYLVDYRLGQQSGLDLLKEINLTERQEPFIILTGANSKSIEMQAMQMGVADYLVKGKFDVELLARVLRYSLQRKRIEAQRIKELVDMNKSKDEFISLASHQLRTPATAVKQYIGMVLQGFVGEVPEEQEAYLQSAYNSNERQLKIVNAILGIARLDLNKIRLNIVHADVISMIKEVIEDLRPEADTRAQRIEFTPHSKTYVIDMDLTYLSMAINNIVDNAIKYSPEQTTVSINVATDKDKCVIEISDEGVGIAPEDHGKLFKKFSRINNPFSISANGTGVGLYWSSEVIKMHHGTIKLDSELHKGTTFRICLPAKQT